MGEIVGKIKKIRGHLITGNEECLYIQRKSKFYKYIQGKEQYVFRIEYPFWKRILINIRLFQRLLRTNIRAFVVCDDKIFYAVSGGLYSYSYADRKPRKELAFRNGMKAPLGLTYIKGMKGFDDQVCFGEYFSNAERTSVNIWSNRNGKWKVVYSFPPNTIRHIHGIVPDLYRDCVYILTGDADKESFIWKAENNFIDVSKYVGGDQKSRCCVLQPRRNCIIYATDSEYEQNKLYRVGVKENGSTERIALYDLSSSVIHGYTSEENRLFFSTTVEPNKGGIHANEAVVYELDENLKLHKIISDKKDGFNPTYFQYGFADIGKSNGKIYVGFTATKKYDGMIAELDNRG